MPFSLPSLKDLRKLNRDNITSRLDAGAMVRNSVLRVMSDANAGLAYLNLLFLKWLSRQFLPDTAEKEWLDRHGNIWLGGRKAATFSSGTVTATGAAGTVIAQGTELTVGVSSAPITFQVTANTTIGSGATSVPVVALTAGSAGNLDQGTTLSFSTAQSGLDGSAIVVSLTGGADEEGDDDLRSRVLFRIQQPPMGGDADDYVRWTLEVPGVTRAWCSPLEMGIGTVTVRFMCDALRATTNPMTNGFPLVQDIAAVQAHLDAKRPVAVKDFFVSAPIPEPVNFTVSNLDSDDESTWANIGASVTAMLADRAAPAYAINGVKQDAQTIFVAWVSNAIMGAAGVESFDLAMTDHVMPGAGSLAVLGSIIRG
jgi:uncharacterized phage protein gp47/JayE